MIEIRHWITGALLYSADVPTVREAVERAAFVRARLDGANLVRASLVGANLVGANLVRANLVGANLVRANLVRARLVGANLDGANLDGARLVGANLDGARLVGANLDGARLVGANLVGARLDGANLVRANLVGANLDGARLDGANLDGANLDAIKADFFSVLDAAPDEVPALCAALLGGRVDGSCYEGQCACLVGTIANARGCSFTALAGLKPDGSRPAERWFLAISPGAPKTHAVVAKTLEWLEEWLATRMAEWVSK